MTEPTDGDLALVEGLEALRPYAEQLRALHVAARGREAAVVAAVLAALDTAAFHFTGLPAFYGPRRPGR
jgi:hypothetical protein